MPPSPLGRILANHGIITEAQIGAAIEYTKTHNCRVGEALIKLGFCTERHVARALAEQNHIPFVDLEETPPTLAALKLIARDVAQEYGVIPVRIDGARLVIVALNPYDLRIDEALPPVAGMPVVVAGGVGTQIRDGLKRYDELRYPKASVANPVAAARSATCVSQRMTISSLQAANSPDLLSPSQQAHTVQAVNALFADAVRRRSSAIQFEPSDDGLRLRCRIDGCMHTISNLSKAERDPVLARVRSMNGIGAIPIGETGKGRCEIHVDGASVQVSTTVTPTAAGHLITCQVNHPNQGERALENLGLSSELLSSLRSVLRARKGLVLVSGPVGSGKLTTLHATLRHLHTLGFNTATLEQTFERKLSGINQFDGNGLSNQSLARLLEKVLQQPADVVAVGELPDRAAAEVALRAAATGQMILSGSYAADALTAITELLDLGIPPHQVASPLRAVLTQRLVRRVCEHCARDYKLPFQLEHAIRTRYTVPEGARFRKGRGCPKCHRIGSMGCVGVFELLVVDADLKFHLSERVPPSVLQEELARRRFRTLEEDAWDKVCQGLVEPEELIRLGLGIAEAHEELTRRTVSESEAAAAVDVPLPSLSEATAEEDEDLESWEAVADFAAMLSAPADAEGAAAAADGGGATPEGAPAAAASEPELESWQAVADLANALGGDVAIA